jgi:hypothetical protein
VSRLLGHSTTAVTEKFYAHLSDARLRAELEAAFIASPYPGVQREPSQAKPSQAKLVRSIALILLRICGTHRRWNRDVIGDAGRPEQLSLL